VGDSIRFVSRTVGIAGSNLLGKGLHVPRIGAFSSEASSLPSARPLLMIAQALLLGQLERDQLDQKAPTLIPLA
jgi:hypothetical protein